MYRLLIQAMLDLDPAEKPLGLEPELYTKLAFEREKQRIQIELSCNKLCCKGLILPGQT